MSIAAFDDVGQAFVFLTSQLKLLLAKTDFSNIKRSCIEQIKTPCGAQLSAELVKSIKSPEISHNIGNGGGLTKMLFLIQFTYCAMAIPFILHSLPCSSMFL